MGRATGGDLVIELKRDGSELKNAFREMQAGMQAAHAEMEGALKSFGVAMRSGFSDIGKNLDRFVTHLDAHAEVLGELTAKVNEHEDRLAAIEAKLP